MARGRRLGDRTALARAAFIVGFVALLAATFANYVLNELGHDEGMYLGASYLAIDHELYSEIGYFQTPNLPLLLSTFFAWCGVSDLLLWGRAVTFAHHALLLTLLAATAWHYTRSASVSLLFTMWIGLNGFLFGAGYSIDNSTYASTYLVAGLYVCIVANERGWPGALTLMAGFVTALAPGFKLNYAPMLACFAVALAIFAPRRALGAFLLGSVVGLAPSLYMLLDRTAAFWFDNVIWHRTLLAMSVDELGSGAMVTGFLSDAWHYASRLTWLATLIVIVPIAIACLKSERKPMWRFDRTLLALIVAASAITIVALGAVRFWYLQPLAITVALFVPSVYAQLTPRRRQALGWLLSTAVAASVWSQAPALVEAPRALEMRAWTPIRYARLGEQIAALIDDAGGESVGAIGNPAIVYGVEGSLPLVRSAATGAFVRVSSPMSLRDDRIATYASLSDSSGGLEMILATVDYVAPHADVEPSVWCDESPHELVARWCDDRFDRRIVGDGPSRVVVFYRSD